jgi:asparagine synthase (glutamine-hydrolysing)
MCGIAGQFTWDGSVVVEHDLLAMREALVHRGPNAGGTFIDGPVGLAHRRLAVIDISASANQPMTTPDGKTVVIFNGEIYNFQSLRTDLEAAGCHFRTRSDTEVLLWGYRIWGIETLARRIDGMAAFALWDGISGELHLVRDRFGIKPLYLTRIGKRLSFASEIKAFLALPEFTVKVNLVALNEYFTFQNLFRNHTLFDGVELMPPGTIITVGRMGREQRRTFWSFDFGKRDQTIGKAEAIEETERLMVGAVQRQLVADVPVGAYLSGGMDSGSIVGIASKSIPRITTFTAGFELSSAVGIEATFDERRDAELMSYAFGTEHYEQVINAGDIRWAMPRVIWHLEDLRVGMSYPNYYVARLASKFVTVCLSGAGGDELFGGYPWRYYRVFRSLGRDEYLHSYYKFWQRLARREERAELFQPTVWNQVGNESMFDVFSQVFDRDGNLSFASPEDHIANSLLFECRTFLHGLLLVGDKLSMAHGLEERFPFLDNALVDFAQRLPIRHKLSDLEHMLSISEDELRKKIVAQSHYAGGKSVLRRSMESFLPESVLNCPKRGFSAPDESWFRGENAAYVRSILLSNDLACADYIRPDFIHRIIREHTEQGINHRLLIWSLLSFEWWCRIFLRGERPGGVA